MSKIKDEMLYAWLQMVMLGTNGISFFKGLAKKECEKYLKILGLLAQEPSDEVIEKLHAMAYNFISISLDSPGYASSILGLKHATKDEARIKMCYDIKKGAMDYLLSFNKDKESEILMEIFRKEYEKFVPNGDEIWDEYFKKHKA